MVRKASCCWETSAFPLHRDEQFSVIFANLAQIKCKRQSVNVDEWEDAICCLMWLNASCYVSGLELSKQWNIYDSVLQFDLRLRKHFSLFSYISVISTKAVVWLGAYAWRLNELSTPLWYTYFFVNFEFSWKCRKAISAMDNKRR